MRNFIIKNIQKIPNEKMFLENKPTRKSFNDLKNLLKSIEDEKFSS